MKKFLKWSFIIFAILIIISMVISSFESDESKAQFEIDKITMKFRTAETEYDISDVFGELNQLPDEYNFPFVQQAIDSLYELKPEFVKKAIKRGINEDQTMAYIQAKDYLSNNLKAPSSAKFGSYNESNVTYDFDKNLYHVKLWCEAQNSFGVMLRNVYEIRVSRIITINNTVNWNLVEITKL